MLRRSQGRRCETCHACMEVFLAQFQIPRALGLCIGNTMLAQYYVTLPPNLTAQLKCGRSADVHGPPGLSANLCLWSPRPQCQPVSMVSQASVPTCVHGLPGLSANLHMQHKNGVVKMTIKGFGANKTRKIFQYREKCNIV